MTTNLSLTLALWTVVYLLDYALTIYAARLYLAGANRHLSFGGSLELTPQFQKDVDQLRRVSPRFIFFLLLSNLALILVWLLAVWVLSLPGLFALAAGAVILREVPVLLRHSRNLGLFRNARQPGALTGRLAYARWLVLRQSATELLGFAVLFVGIFALAHDWFWLGGAVGCAFLAHNHWRMARRARAPIVSAGTPPGPPDPGH
jgi:hypothetical protein